MIKKKYHTVDIKGQYHIQKSCILIWKHNLNKSTHISLNLKFKTLNNIMINVLNIMIIQTKLQWNIKKIITIMFWILKLIN
jgi:hypothetical protein